jgi:hypothetical protein
MAKSKKDRIPSFLDETTNKAEFFKEALKIELGQRDVPLPTADEVNESIAAATNKPLPTPEKVEKIVSMVLAEKESVAANEPKSFGRPKKVEAIGRVPFTTSLSPLLVLELKKKALLSGMSTADLLSQILSNNLRDY